MRAWTSPWAACLVALALTACPGEAVRPDREVSYYPDGMTPGSETGGEPCSKVGVAAACDPVAGTGCKSGSSCYVLKSDGPSCACSGSKATGEACQTTLECAPGNVCQGTSPPGVCRKACGMADPKCPTTMSCVAITAFPQYGSCQPK